MELFAKVDNTLLYRVYKKKCLQLENIHEMNEPAKFVTMIFHL